MKGNASVWMGVAVLLVAGAVVLVKVAGRKDGTAEEGTEETSGGKTARKSGPVAGGKATKKARPERTRRGRDRERPQEGGAILSGGKAAQQGRGWLGDVLQTKNPAKREAAIAAMKEALIGDDEMAAYAALKACMGMEKAEFDRAWFRDLVEPYLDAEDPGMRRSAWFAFANTERRPEDLARVRELALDPAVEVRSGVSRLLFLYEDGDLTGESGGVVLGMLNVEEGAAQRQILHGMTGASMSPELEGKVIAMSRSNNTTELNDAVASLSAQANKSSASVERLVEVVSEGNANVAGRAATGLRQGVSEDAQRLVAVTAVTMVSSGQDARMRSHGIDLLGRYGTEDQRSELERLASDPSLDAGTRRSVQLILQKLK